MTLNDIVNLVKTARHFNIETLNTLDLVLAGSADTAQRSALAQIASWLQQIEEHSGNDEELADDIGGTLSYVRTALAQMEERDGRDR